MSYRDNVPSMQGIESEGQGCGSTSTLCLVPGVIDALQEKGFDKVAVLAAGGIANGGQVRVLQRIGASGA